MKRFLGKLEAFFNDLSIRKKLMVIYIFCMVLPLVVTDGIVFAIIYNSERNNILHDMENTANAVKYDMEYFFDEAMTVSNNIYLNSAINDFLNTKYKDGSDYYEAITDILEIASFDKYAGYNVTNIIVYADNETIVNGGHFYRLSEVSGAPWYEKLESTDRNATISFYYIGDEDKSAMSKRKIYLTRHLDYFRNGCKKDLRIDLDYNKFARTLTSKDYPCGVYITNGDRILFSNRGHSGSNEDFSTIDADLKFDYFTDFDFCGETFRIFITRPKSSMVESIRANLFFILLLLSFNSLLPFIMVAVINRSFTARLSEIGTAFDEAEAENLKPIANPSGSDEIGTLMHNYNRMAERLNDMIRSVYVDRLKRQEMELAKQNAELLALHSQINPHFLFNVLESIRMRCVLQNENVTAGMIEKLAVLERQAINWASDNITLEEELSFIKAYLDLQKYRFGERLKYEIDAASDCLSCILPKLTLTVFVENSCVHGMEEKTSVCWIYVRAYRKGDRLILEIEDTGNGLDEADVAALNKQMEESTIDDIKESEHVGTLNACLRFKMFTNGDVTFKMESEKGVGTFMTINMGLTDKDEDGIC